MNRLRTPSIIKTYIYFIHSRIWLGQTKIQNDNTREKMTNLKFKKIYIAFNFSLRNNLYIENTLERVIKMGTMLLSLMIITRFDVFKLALKTHNQHNCSRAWKLHFNLEHLVVYFGTRKELNERIYGLDIGTWEDPDERGNEKRREAKDCKNGRLREEYRNKTRQ